MDSVDSCDEVKLENSDSETEMTHLAQTTHRKKIFCEKTSGKISNEKASEMIKSLFAEKLKEKEDEVELISQRIKEVQSALQLVRYGSVTNISNQTQIYVSSNQTIIAVLV